jgi:hypothetical protein
LVVVFGGGCTVDLRPDPVRESGITPAEAERGRALLAELSKAHGGLERWRGHRTARVVLRDTWPSAMWRALAMPWEANGQSLELTTRLGTDDSRIRFAEPPEKDTVWGVQNWATYIAEPGEEPTFVDDDNVKFWVPTMTYFFEAPFRLHEADVVTAMDPVEIDGATYDRVFLSWGQAAPRDDIDQYVVWIDRTTGRLAFLSYTVRDIMDSAQGLMHYSDYREVDGIWVAYAMAVVDAPDTLEPGLHRIDLDTVEFAVDVPDEVFYPAPGRVGSKH